MSKLKSYWRYSVPSQYWFQAWPERNNPWGDLALVKPRPVDVRDAGGLLHGLLGTLCGLLNMVSQGGFGVTLLHSSSISAGLTKWLKLTSSGVKYQILVVLPFNLKTRRCCLFVSPSFIFSFLSSSFLKKNYFLTFLFPQILTWWPCLCLHPHLTLKSEQNCPHLI